LTPNLHNEQQPSITPEVSSPEGGSRSEGIQSPRVLELIDEAEAAFLRDLPSLLNEYSNQWVAYHGDRRLGIGPAKAELYQDCLQRGFSPEELVVWNIQPVVGEMVVTSGQIEFPV
jgi:hypothetical protein